MDYTIVGGQLNSTSRLESAAANDQILISHATYALVKDEIYCKPFGQLQVKGIARPIKSYETISTSEEYRKRRQRIEETGDAFNLSVDLNALDADERRRAKEPLMKALLALDE